MNMPSPYLQLAVDLNRSVIFFLNHTSEKQLYIIGDTVWCNEVQTTLEKYNPDVVVVNAGNAQFVDGRYLIMSKEEIYEVSKTVPNAKLLATHMEAVNHCMLSRSELRSYAEEKDFTNRLSIPADGETCEF